MYQLLFINETCSWLYDCKQLVYALFALPILSAYVMLFWIGRVAVYQRFPFLFVRLLNIDVFEHASATDENFK